MTLIVPPERVPPTFCPVFLPVFAAVVEHEIVTWWLSEAIWGASV